MAFAASCAAFFSKARNEGKVPVAKALVSDLSKPAGAAPGKVSTVCRNTLGGKSTARWLQTLQKLMRKQLWP